MKDDDAFMVEPASHDATVWPNAVIVDGEGVWLRKNGERGGFLCAPVEIVAQTRDRDGGSWGRLVRFRDGDHKEKELVLLSRELVTGNTAFVALVDAGLRVTANPKHQEHLRQALMDAVAPDRVVLAPQPGWVGHAYVFRCGRTVGDAAEPVRLITPPQDAPLTSGDLRAWRTDVAAHAEANPLLLLALCAALAGPLLRIFEHDGPVGLHFVGPSSSGKTTLLKTAAAAAAAPLKTWNATINGAEASAAAANDGVLAVDELGVADARTVARTVYAVGNGSGRARMTKGLADRKVLTWRAVVLSSGELGVQDKVANASEGRATVGLSMRLLEIVVPDANDGGAFPAAPHGVPAATFVNQLRDAAQRHGAAPLVALLEAFTANRDANTAMARRLVNEARGAFDAAQGGQQARAADVFAMLAAAGEMATALGVTRWRVGAARDACSARFSEWAKRAGGPSQEECAAIAVVREHLHRYGESQFTSTDYDPERHVVRDRAGWKLMLGDTSVFAISPDVFKAEMCGDLGERQVLRALDRRGYLVRGEGDNMKKKVKIKDRHQRMVVVRDTILEGERHDEH